MAALKSEGITYGSLKLQIGKLQLTLPVEVHLGLPLSELKSADVSAIKAFAVVEGAESNGESSRTTIDDELVASSSEDLSYDDDSEEEVTLKEEPDRELYHEARKLIEDGMTDKLKVKQCKAYLRKHKMRLSGRKDVLICRIKEYVKLKNGLEDGYSEGTFNIDCTGDVCRGDVVLFEQNVYSRKLAGTRTNAGRVVHESYGSKKQQHTFTIEVLWSKGTNALRPMRQLMIKGRKLYQATKRQPWTDEQAREACLDEKHLRGLLARKARAKRLAAERTILVQMRNVPYSAKPDDIQAFFNECRLTRDAIYILRNDHGKPLGDVIVVFSEEDGTRALEKHQSYLGGRKIQLSKARSPK